MNRTNYKIALQSKEWLTNALFELIDKYDYNSITISQICRKADLSRRTFYRLYNSKEDILVEKIASLTSVYLSSIDDTIHVNYLDMASSYFEFWYNHKNFLLLLCKSNLIDSIFQNLQIKIPGICKSLKRSDNEICNSSLLHYINSFGFGGLNSMILDWIKNGMMDSPRVMMDALSQFLDSTKYKAY